MLYILIGALGALLVLGASYAASALTGESRLAEVGAPLAVLGVALLIAVLKEDEDGSSPEVLSLLGGMVVAIIYCV